MAEISELAMSCCVNKCANKSGSHGVRLFKFPSSLLHRIQRNQWIQTIQEVNGKSWLPTSTSAVCSAHFITKEPHDDSENEDFAPSLFNFDKDGSDIRTRTLTIKQFALEYIRHDELLKDPVSVPISDERKQAYHLLSKSLHISFKKVLAWEKRLRNFLEQGAISKSRSKKIQRVKINSAWVKIVDQKLQTVQAYIENKLKPLSKMHPGRLILALRWGAEARGLLCSTPLYTDVRRALRLPVALNDLHVAWVKAQQASLNELAASSRMGDWPPYATSLDSMKIADLVLMHTDVYTHRLINDESLFLYEEAKALQLLVQLIHTHQCEGEMPNKLRAQRWTRLYKDYLQSGRVASLVALQRRWHELALQARARLASYWRQTRARHAHAYYTDATLVVNLPFPAPIHIQIIKRYPHIALKPFIGWRTLVACGMVIPQPLDDMDLNLETPLTNPRPATENTAGHDGERNHFDDKYSKESLIDQNKDCDSKATENFLQSDDSENELFIVEHPSNNEHSVKNLEQNEHSEQKKIHTVSKKEENIVCPTIAALNTINPTDCETEIVFSSDSDDDIEPLVNDVKVQNALPAICSRLLYTNDVDSDSNEDEDSSNPGFDKQLLMDVRVNVVQLEENVKHLRPGTSLNISEINTNIHRKTNADDLNKIDNDNVEENHYKIGNKDIEIQVNDEIIEKASKSDLVKESCNNIINEMSMQYSIPKEIARKDTDSVIERKTENIFGVNTADKIVYKSKNISTAKPITTENLRMNATTTSTTLDETSGAKYYSLKKRILNQLGATSGGTDNELNIDTSNEKLDSTTNYIDSDGTRAVRRVELRDIDEAVRVKNDKFIAQNIPACPASQLNNWNIPAVAETTVSEGFVSFTPTEGITYITNNPVWMWRQREQEVDFINIMPTQQQLNSLLDELSYATPMQQGMGHRQCCLARCTRALNDQRACSGDPPLPLHDHKDEKCNCCCQYLCARTMTIKHNADRMELCDEISALIKKASVTAIKRRIQKLNTKSAKAIEASAAMLNTLRLKKQALPTKTKTKEEILTATDDISATNIKESAVPSKKSLKSVEPKIKSSKSVKPSKKSSTSEKSPKESLTSVKKSTDSSKSLNLSKKPKPGRPKKSAPKTPTPSTMELRPRPPKKHDDNGYSEWQKQKNINASHFRIAGMIQKQNTITPSQRPRPNLRPRLNVTLEITVPPKSIEKSAKDKNESNDDNAILTDVTVTPINPELDNSITISQESVKITPPEKMSKSLLHCALTSASSTFADQTSENSVDQSLQTTSQNAVTLPTESTMFQSEPKIPSDNLIKSTTDINLEENPVQIEKSMVLDILLPSDNLSKSTTDINLEENPVQIEKSMMLDIPFPSDNLSKSTTDINLEENPVQIGKSMILDIPFPSDNLSKSSTDINLGENPVQIEKSIVLDIPLPSDNLSKSSTDINLEEIPVQIEKSHQSPNFGDNHATKSTTPFSELKIDNKVEFPSDDKPRKGIVSFDSDEQSTFSTDSNNSNTAENSTADNCENRTLSSLRDTFDETTTNSRFTESLEEELSQNFANKCLVTILKPNTGTIEPDSIDQTSRNPWTNRGDVPTASNTKSVENKVNYNKIIFNINPKTNKKHNSDNDVENPIAINTMTGFPKIKPLSDLISEKKYIKELAKKRMLSESIDCLDLNVTSPNDSGSNNRNKRFINTHIKRRKSTVNDYRFKRPKKIESARRSLNLSKSSTSVDDVPTKITEPEWANRVKSFFAKKRLDYTTNISASSLSPPTSPNAYIDQSIDENINSINDAQKVVSLNIVDDPIHDDEIPNTSKHDLIDLTVESGDSDTFDETTPNKSKKRLCGKEITKRSSMEKGERNTKRKRTKSNTSNKLSDNLFNTDNTDTLFEKSASTASFNKETTESNKSDKEYIRIKRKNSNSAENIVDLTVDNSGAEQFSNSPKSNRPHASINIDYFKKYEEEKLESLKEKRNQTIKKITFTDSETGDNISKIVTVLPISKTTSPSSKSMELLRNNKKGKKRKQMKKKLFGMYRR